MGFGVRQHARAESISKRSFNHASATGPQGHTHHANGATPFRILSCSIDFWSIVQSATVVHSAFCPRLSFEEGNGQENRRLIAFYFRFPNGPSKTTIVTHYLFAASTVEDDNFDPSEVVDFSEMVAGQDIRVCEIVQRGVASKYFTNGILTPKDDLVINYTQHYLDAMQRP